jgi:hypothetical protein
MRTATALIAVLSVACVIPNAPRSSESLFVVRDGGAGTIPADSGTEPSDSGTNRVDSGTNDGEDAAVDPSDASDFIDAGEPDAGPADPVDAGPMCGDVQSDPSNCGACGNVCPGADVCQGGACVCETHFECPDDGGTMVCLDLSDDPENCGGCGRLCPEGIACVNFHCDCPAGIRCQ